MSLDIFFNGHLEVVVAQCHRAEMLPVDLAKLSHGEPGRIRRVGVAVIGVRRVVYGLGSGDRRGSAELHRRLGSISDLAILIDEDGV